MSIKLDFFDLPRDIRVELKDSFRGNIFDCILLKYKSFSGFARKFGLDKSLLFMWKYGKNSMPLYFLKFVSQEFDICTKEIEENIKYLAGKGKIKLRFPFVIEKDFAWLLGFLITDGHINKNLRTVVAVNKEIYLLKKVSKVIQKYFRGSIKYIHFESKCNGPKVKVILIHNKNIGRILTKFILCGKKYDTIKVPEIILNTNDIEIIRHFLQGIFDGDGTARFDRKSYSRAVTLHSFSYQLVQDVKRLLFKLGIQGNFYKLGKSNGYSVQITGYKNIILFSELINFNQRKRKEILKLMITSYKQPYQKPDGKSKEIATNVINQTQPCTSVEFAKTYGCSRIRAQIILLNLRKEGIIEKTGIKDKYFLYSIS